jgi:hypothetical protein
MTSIIVNNVYFQNLKSCQILSFLCIPKYKVSRVQILHVGTLHHCQHMNIFPEFLETFKYIFRFFQKTELHAQDYCLRYPYHQRHWNTRISNWGRTEEELWSLGRMVVSESIYLAPRFAGALYFEHLKVYFKFLINSKKNCTYSQ